MYNLDSTSRYLSNSDKMGANIRPIRKSRLEIKEAFCQALGRKYNQTRKR